MRSKAPFGATKAVLGCSVVVFILGGIIGLIISFFVDNPAVGSMIRTRCLYGIILGAAFIVLWKVIENYID